ncbi:MAG: helix-turn-helix domain-containing protein [Candidatus Dormiibacterota bacterium]
MISSKDAARRLGVSQATVLRCAARGLLKPVLVTPGGHRRFSLQEVEAFAATLDIDPLHSSLITTGEAARLLGVSQPTLNRAVRAGRLRPALVTPGGHRRFDGAELTASLSFDARDLEGC